MCEGREVVLGTHTFREGQTVTLCQPGRTLGTAMLNTISCSANGTELWRRFGLCVCLCACLWNVYLWLCVFALLHICAVHWNTRAKSGVLTALKEMDKKKKKTGRAPNYQHGDKYKPAQLWSFYNQVEGGKENRQKGKAGGCKIISHPIFRQEE